MTNKRTSFTPPAPQDVCIDLPGQAVSCWRSSDKIRIILRKHRDVFFDINLKAGATYSVESTSDFYFPRTKKILKNVQFQDGEHLHIWVGREFRGGLTLKQGSAIIGHYSVSMLDEERYVPDPKVKPEPLMVILGSRKIPNPIVKHADDPYGVLKIQNFFNPQYDPKIAILKGYGTKHNYSCERGDPEIKEYVCVTEAVSSDLHQHVVQKLEKEGAVEGNITEIFIPPTSERGGSGLYVALASTISYVSGNEILTSNLFKESAGYLQEHWRSLDKILMRVRVEKKPKENIKSCLKESL